jgi:hypothetical protein
MYRRAPFWSDGRAALERRPSDGGWETTLDALGSGNADWHGGRITQHRSANEVDAMTICGVITTKDVLRHSATIVREFGAAVYIRCCMAILLRRRTTFLNCVGVLETE